MAELIAQHGAGTTASQATRPPEPRMLAARQVASTFAAEVPDMPVHGDISPELLNQFVSLLHRYRVLVIPGVRVEPADLVAFSRRFGPLEIHSRFTGKSSASAMWNATA